MKKVLTFGFILGVIAFVACSEFSPDQEVIPAMSGGQYIEGTVTDNNGEPVEGALVEYFHPYELGPGHSFNFHRCSYDLADENGEYTCDMTGHGHNDYCLGKCTPPPGSGLTTQIKKVFVPDEDGKDWGDVPLVDWILLPPK